MEGRLKEADKSQHSTEWANAHSASVLDVMPKEMLYWRRDSFEKLATLQERLREHPELAQYIEYLNSLERGLRRQAMERIAPLIASLRELDVGRQRELASILCRETEVSSGHKLIPHPLRTEFIAPVIRDWMESDPDAAEPRRWTGDLDDLKRAVELDLSCDRTRWRLIMSILGYVGFTTHELPHGYLGDVETDEDLLILAGREAQRLIDDETRAKCLDLIREEQSEIDAYKQTRHNPKDSW